MKGTKVLSKTTKKKKNEYKRQDTTEIRSSVLVN